MLDFENDSLVESAYLITIITEAVLRDSVVSLLRNLKVKNYTLSEVQGEGRYVRYLGTIGESPAITNLETNVETSVEIRAVVSQELSNVIMYALKEQKRNFAITVYRQKVEILVDE